MQTTEIIPVAPAAHPYQLFPPLRPEEYEALKADIAARGVLVPVEIDETGSILDGHHRAQIAGELGLRYPTVTRTFATEREKHTHVVKVNLARRHLDPIRWGQMFATLLVSRGVATGQGARNDRRTSATVAEVAAELGIPARTARARMRDWRRYEALPPDRRVLVDAGMRLAKAERYPKDAERLAKRGRETGCSTISCGGTVCGACEPVGQWARRTIVPLETCWPSPATLLIRRSERVDQLIPTIREDLLPATDKDGIADPVFLEAIDRLREAVFQVERILEDAAADLAVAAYDANDVPIPWPPRGDRDRLIASNAQQKNWRGFCRVLGCWAPVTDRPFCPGCREEGDEA